MNDAVDRQAIRDDLQTTMLVEAAAGTGKTTSLVTRAIALLRHGLSDIGHLAAVTFTLKAAAQLRERMQEGLERELRTATGVERARLEKAARDLDRAFIGTTHAFCGRLLRERPIEAGLDPDFEEVDQAEAAMMALDFWQRWIQGRAAAGDADLAVAREAGLGHELLRGAFVRLLDHHGDVEIVSERCARPDLEGAVSAVRTFLRTVEADLPDDSKRETQDNFEVMVRRLLRIEKTLDLDDVQSQIAFLDAGAHGSAKPTQRNWPDKARAKSYGIAYAPIGGQIVKPLLLAWREYVHCIAMSVLVPALDDFERERRQAGRLTFNDLLLGARNLLRDHPEVRRYFQRRFTHVLVDEFQDTDPLQAEVLFFLTGNDAEQTNWKELVPRAGSLFIVGDPKQSIYRFRRADITTYATVRQRIAVTGGRIVTLSTNFRSSRSICEFVNGVFPRLFDEAAVAAGRQARHVALEHRHENGGIDGGIDGVYLLESQAGRYEEIAEEEALCIARWIRRAVDSRLLIRENGVEREVRWNDVLLVSRVRKRLDIYAAALEREGVPFEVTGASRFAQSPWLRAAIPLLRAIAEPDDAVSLVSFLRGPYCGVADDELANFVRDGGRWSVFRDLPERTAESVADGFQLVRGGIEDARSLPPAAAIARTFERVGIVARAAADEQPGSAAGNALLALAMARSESARGASYAEIVDSLAEMLETNVEVEEMDVDPKRANAVRLMNLHQVKGLEAPVVFLIDSAGSSSPTPDAHVDRSGEHSRGYFAIRKREGGWDQTNVAQPRGWDALVRVEQQYREAEENRLLYVAATRAKNVLVVGATRRKGDLVGWWSRLAEHAAPTLFGSGEEVPRAAREPVEGESHGEAIAGIARRRELAGQQSYSVVPVTRIAHDSHEKLLRAEEGLGMGTSWGRVLHRLFESMLREPSIDIRFYAASLLKDEERDAAELDQVVATVEAVRSSPLWQRVIAADEKYAEVPFAVNVPARSIGLDRDGETLLHGTIDLVFREGARWYIVDYKSDSTAGRLDALVAYYKPQVEHYARFWREMTGAETIAGLFFVDGCVEMWEL